MRFAVQVIGLVHFPAKVMVTIFLECTGDREAHLLSGMLIRELQKQASEAFIGQASQV